MDYKDGQIKRQNPNSVLHGDGYHFGKILSRESSVGQSSRIYYRSSEGVPFKWEMQPGTPKNPPENHVMPPLSPPPAVLNLGLPKPCLDQPQKMTWSRNWFWRKIKKSQTGHKVQKSSKEISNNTSSRSEFGESDGEFMESVVDNSSSSFALSSSSSNNGPPLKPPKYERDLLDGHFCCSPWNITATLIEGNPNTCYRPAQKIASPLHRDGSSLDRILSRNSPLSRSSRIYNCNAHEGIPFQWEMQPGTPKNSPEDMIILPPSPPPAVQSLGLTRPRAEQPKGPNRSPIKFWKIIKKQCKRVREWIVPFHNSSPSCSKVCSIRSSKVQREIRDETFCYTASDVMKIIFCLRKHA